VPDKPRKTVVTVLDVEPMTRLGCCDEDGPAVWVKVTAWSPRRAFLTDAAPFLAVSGRAAEDLPGLRFFADLDLDNPPGMDTAGERLEWPGLGLCPPVPAEWLATPEDEDQEAEEGPRRCEGGGTLLPDGGREEDHERALRLVAALAPGTADMKFFVIDGDPASKSRPRLGRGGKTYKTTEDANAEARTGWHFRRAFRGDKPWTGNVALGCVFFRPNRQRIDVDNMLKHICDSANGIAWADDSQVTAAYGIAEFDAEHPRTLVVLARHHSTLTRGSDNARICAHCGGRFNVAGLKSTQQYCSHACVNKALGRDLSEPVNCKECGKPFRRKTTTQVLCSSECRAASLKGRPRPRRSERRKCSECGAQLNHSRGGRCRACYLADPRPQTEGADR
jgi:Holliday junction resolvase RusA-like endonuclease